jgi:hypothetical protein
MDFTDEEWETILWAVGGKEWLVLKLRQWVDQINAGDEIEKVEPKLAGALVTPEEVEALIAHVERSGR